MYITTMSGVARTDTTVTTPTGNVSYYDHESRYIVQLHRPDEAIKNKRQWDGFRPPSSYACATRGSSYTAPQGGFLPVVVDVVGGGTPRYDRYQFSGQCAVDIRSAPLPNEANALRMKILNNVRNEVLDVAMVFAELSSTAQTLSNNLLRLARSLEQIQHNKRESFYYLLNGRRKDNRRPTDKFLRETAGIFMEWKYGIMPTVYDIKGATKALDMNEDNSFWENPALLVNRASIKGETPFKDSQRTNVAGNPSNYNRVEIEGIIEWEHKARVDYTVTGEGLRGLNRYGIGLGTIATVAFEKTPFSFVLNMALPIADLIKAWTALAGCDVRGYCETQWSRIRLPGNTSVFKQNGITYSNVVAPQVYPPSFKRTAFDTVPMPLPHVRNPVKLSNIQTVLALFTQLRKG